MTTSPDLFTNVHKGIRKALFDACVALGRAEGDARLEGDARAALDDALAFVVQHGDNEDALLVPLLERRAPALAARLHDAHRDLDEHTSGLRSSARTMPIGALYLRACEFVARYLHHMHEEESDLEPRIRTAVSDAEIGAVGRESVGRTPPAEGERMLAIMLPALPRGERNALLARIPEPLARKLALHE